MKRATKFLALVMALCMTALAFAGCGGQDMTWIATDKNGTELPVGIFLYHRFEAYTKALELAEDKSTDAWGQQIEGISCYDWVENKAVQEVKNYMAVEEKFEEQGYTLAEDQIAYAKQQAANRYSYYDALYEANGISAESIEDIYMNNMKRSVIFQATYAPGGTQGLSVDDLKGELQEDYVSFKVVMIPNTDVDGAVLEGEALKEAEALRDDYLKRAQAGEDFDELIAESEDKYIRLEMGDENYKPTESDYGHDHADKNAHLTVMRKDSTEASVELLEAVAAAKEGDIGKVDDLDYFYVFQRLDMDEDIDQLVETLKAQLTSDLKADDFDKEVEDWGNAVELSMNEKVLSHYKKKDFAKAKID